MSIWKTVREEIFENTQLDIYEKMCLLVLMSAEEGQEEIHMSSELLAKNMGCGVATAKRAFDSLRIKGYFTKDYKSTPPKVFESAVIKNDEDVVEVTRVLDEISEDFKEGFFTEGVKKVEQEPITQSKASVTEVKRDREAERRRLLAEYLLTPEQPKPLAEAQLNAFISQKEKKESLVDEVIAIMDEKISFKEANILLGFAGNDIERIKSEYKKAKALQVSDTMGALINALQKKPETSETKGSVLTGGTQVDTNRLRKMQAYRQNGMK